MKKNASRALVLAALLTSGAGLGTAMAQQKIAVKTADELPRHSYTVPGKPSEFLLQDAEFKVFARKVAADVEKDLSTHDIQDPTTLQSMYRVLQATAMLDGKYEAALEHANKVRELEQKESKKLMSGLVMRSFIAAKMKGAEGEALSKAFGEDLQKQLSGLPWDKISDEVKQVRGQTQFVTKELIMGQIQTQLDPVAAGLNGVISEDIARGLISTKFTMDTMLPLFPTIGKVYGEVLAANDVQKVNIWADRDWAASGKYGEVTVCIWDSGTDVSLFEGNVWTNAQETENGKDDDGNGFIDDMHGIAWDLTAKPVAGLLHGLEEMKNPIETVTAYAKGLDDTQSGITSKESEAFIKYVQTLKGEQVKTFLEDLGLFGNYSHGTHVAGIAAAGNPFIKLLPIRITFDYRSIPLHAPSLELARQEAAAAKASVEYMKKAGVRVVNMSWGGSRADIEATLESKNVGKDAKERAELARELFGIQKEALEQAIRSAPEILFVAAAGNSDNNVQFSEMIPSGLKADNLITVGAVDQSGKPTSFTSFGPGVGLYANGFEVESYIPGGKRMKFNGTSMAAPQVANLAAKLLIVNPKLTVSQLIEAIRAGGDPLGGDSTRLLINPKKSVELLQAE